MQYINILKLVINKFLSIFNLKIASLNTINLLHAEIKTYKDKLAEITSESVYDLIHKISPSLLHDYVRSIPLSKSQFAQDLFVLTELNFKKNGFFIEFGASHPTSGSNTYLLESDFGWNNILAEPSKSCHDQLLRNRNVFVEKDCVWHTSDATLSFIEHGVLSTRKI